MGMAGKAVRAAFCAAALTLVAMPGTPMAAGPGGHDAEMGERIFSGNVGPWAAEARLVDRKAQLEHSGVSAKTASRFAGKHHLMLFLTDPATGKPAAGVAGKVVITGPGKTSSSIVTLIPMGEHIGVDVDLPAPGKYTFQAEVESGGKKGSATFLWTLK